MEFIKHLILTLCTQSITNLSQQFSLSVISAITFVLQSSLGIYPRTGIFKHLSAYVHHTPCMKFPSIKPGLSHNTVSNYVNIWPVQTSPRSIKQTIVSFSRLGCCPDWCLKGTQLRISAKTRATLANICALPHPIELRNKPRPSPFKSSLLKIFQVTF